MTNTAAGIMIVDDELFFRELLGEMVRESGHTVIAEASYGVEAVERYQALRPALVLMDIFMPEMNGIEATREIMAADPGARILICSGVGYDDDANAAMAAGARGLLFKPFYADEVKAEIFKLLAG